MSKSEKFLRKILIVLCFILDSTLLVCAIITKKFDVGIALFLFILYLGLFFNVKELKDVK